jgi:hypothetical protein
MGKKTSEVMFHVIGRLVAVGQATKFFKPKTRCSRTAPQNRRPNDEKQPKTFQKFCSGSQAEPHRNEVRPGFFLQKTTLLCYSNLNVIKGKFLTFHL